MLNSEMMKIAVRIKDSLTFTTSLSIMLLPLLPAIWRAFIGGIHPLQCPLRVEKAGLCAYVCGYSLCVHICVLQYLFTSVLLSSV